MQATQADIEDFKKQIENGSIQRAYQAIISYMMDLRTHFANLYGDSAVSALYQGYMDMTYFAIFPPALKPHELKVAVVFNFDAFRFEAWLGARNRKIQRQYWETFRVHQWEKLRVVAPGKGIDAIVECDLADQFEIDQLDALTSKIDDSAAAFLQIIEKFLSEQF